MATGFTANGKNPFPAKDATDAQEGRDRDSEFPIFLASFASFAVKPPFVLREIARREKINFHNVLDLLSHCDVMAFLLNC
jgi:hypothetical protein